MGVERGERRGQRQIVTVTERNKYSIVETEEACPSRDRDCAYGNSRL
jgi:hypothetical protein